MGKQYEHSLDNRVVKNVISGGYGIIFMRKE